MTSSTHAHASPTAANGLDRDERTVAAIDRRLLDGLGRRHGDDAVQEVLMQYVTRRQLHEGSRPGELILVNPAANDPGHVVAGFIVAVRRVSQRQAARASTSTARLARFHDDRVSSHAPSVEEVVTERASTPAVAALRTALDGIEPSTREALHRHIVDETPFEELAGELSVSADTLRKRCHRARQHLANRIGAEQLAA